MRWLSPSLEAEVITPTTALCPRNLGTRQVSSSDHHNWEPIKGCLCTILYLYWRRICFRMFIKSWRCCDVRTMQAYPLSCVCVLFYRDHCSFAFSFLLCAGSFLHPTMSNIDTPLPFTQAIQKLVPMNSSTPLNSDLASCDINEALHAI